MKKNRTEPVMILNRKGSMHCFAAAIDAGWKQGIKENCEMRRKKEKINRCSNLPCKVCASHKSYSGQEIRSILSQRKQAALTHLCLSGY